ncbi:MAG: secondary thiamine-phosphate synthase enzyme YjbQ [Polyangiales bacterium]
MFHNASIEIQTRGRGFYDLTEKVQAAVRDAGIAAGLCTVFVHHTSASLIITENADPAVHRDLEAFVSKLAPDGDPLFTHTDEGPDDMPSHVRSALTQTSLGIPIAGTRCDLGTWQGVYLWEHRHAPHSRRITISIVGQ